MINPLENHPTFTQTENLKNICEPLSLLNITTFSHLKVFANHQLTLLCNHPQFVLNYLQKKYYTADPCVNIKPEPIDFGEYLVWDMVDCQGKTAEMLAESNTFNFKHVFTIIKKSTDFTDFYHFGTHLFNPAIHQIYINNLEILNRFIQFFNEKVRTSKSLSKAYNIVLNSDQKYAHAETAEHQDNFLFKTKIPKQALLQALHPPGLPHLTKRERECAELVIKGQTTKEIALLLGLSFRTIEDRIDSLKNKLDARNKTELVIRLLGFE